MLANRPLEVGILIAFLLAIGFCSRIDPALSESVVVSAPDENSAETIEDGGQDSSTLVAGE